MYWELRTPRLLLRPLGPGDLEAVHAYASDPENTRYMLFLPYETLEETAAALAEAGRQWDAPDPASYQFAVILDGIQIGEVFIYLSDDRTEGEIGWILDRRYWGRSYALEAAGAVRDFAFRELDLRRLTAQCDTRNGPSQRLMEKLGMTLLDDSGTRTYRKRDETAPELTYILDSPR